MKTQTRKTKEDFWQLIKNEAHKNLYVKNMARRGCEDYVVGGIYEFTNEVEKIFKFYIDQESHIRAREAVNDIIKIIQEQEWGVMDNDIDGRILLDAIDKYLSSNGLAEEENNIKE